MATNQVYIVAPYGGAKYWLIKAENQRGPNGRLILQGKWGSSAEAQPVSLELAAVYRRRFAEETHCDVYFTLSASDSAPYFEESNSSNAQGEDNRQAVSYRNLLARPGINTRNGERCWYVRISEGNQQLESIRGTSPEAAIDRVYEMNFVQHNENDLA